MKNYKRAERRHKQHTKFIGRVKKWFAQHWANDPKEIKKALTGEGYTFLKTTSRPCNCYDCSGNNKYKRKKKAFVLKQMLDE